MTERLTRDKAVAMLREGNHSLVVARDGEFRCFDSRGVADLYRLLSNEPEVLDGAFVADKVVGKGAAALMSLGHVKGVNTGVISRGALELLDREGVVAEYDLLVENIINRTGTGICPVESLCSAAVTAAECKPLIDKFINEQQIKTR